MISAIVRARALRCTSPSALLRRASTSPRTRGGWKSSDLDKERLFGADLIGSVNREKNSFRCLGSERENRRVSRRKGWESLHFLACREFCHNGVIFASSGATDSGSARNRLGRGIRQLKPEYINAPFLSNSIHTPSSLSSWVAIADDRKCPICGIRHEDSHPPPQVNQSSRFSPRSDR